MSRSSHSDAIQSWLPSAMPDTIRLQIIAFMRQVWPDGFRGENLHRCWIHPAGDNPLHFIGMLPNGCVAAHASALWRPFSAYGQEWRIGGLSGVFTFQHLRKEGWGGAVINAAREYLETLHLDAAIFCCEKISEPFYRNAGWEILPGSTLTLGNPPRIESGTVLFRSFGARGDQLKKHLAESPLHFGDYTW